MPLFIPLILYLSCVVMLVAAGAIALSEVLQPPGAQFAHTTPSLQAAPPILPAAADASDTPVTSSADRPPAWIAPTPKYDMPPPGAAKRAVEQARKAASHARKARARAREPQFGAIPEAARQAYGSASPPVFFSVPPP